ncbi:MULTISPECIES: hypothetical protein [Helcococcus]|uniref:Uncharacterized protein n=1 Tax=Helcococcus bovis TaxID=3153252 RepID=A0ABW9F7X7_9FIRM
MKLYFYESHLGGIYVSQRDDLDGICPQCGDSDVKVTVCDYEGYRDLVDTFFELLSYGMDKQDFDKICETIASYGIDVVSERNLFISMVKRVIE